MEISVIIPTHNPNAGRLRAALLGLRTQTLPASRWETILVDNASDRSPELSERPEDRPENLRVVSEPKLGLSTARRRGLLEARADIAVLVDDDNVLAPEYLAWVLEIFSRHPRVGIAGGKSIGRFEVPPPDWAREFLGLLAIRDLGEQEILSAGLRPPGAARNHFPEFAPIGAGMALRRPAWTAWIESAANGTAGLPDRRGADLSSAGDNEMILCALQAGWDVGYFPKLSLTHLIPSGRLRPDYLARLNRGIQKSWMQVLLRHDACPWPPLSAGGSAIRKLKAWFTHAAWSGPAARIRWQGACGHFDGRVSRRKQSEEVSGPRS